MRTKVHTVVMYGCDSWIVKKAEYRRIDAFELWCWRRLLRVSRTARRSNQSILKEISPGMSLEGLMLKLKLQYFGHFMWRVDSLEKTLMLGGTGGRRKRGWQRMRWLDGITDSMDVSLRWLSNWTELNWSDFYWRHKNLSCVCYFKSKRENYLRLHKLLFELFYIANNYIFVYKSTITIMKIQISKISFVY